MSWPCLSRPFLGDCVAIVRTPLCNLRGLRDVKRRFEQALSRRAAEPRANDCYAIAWSVRRCLGIVIASDSDAIQTRANAPLPQRPLMELVRERAVGLAA